jgi:anti-anti-sigma factor
MFYEQSHRSNPRQLSVEERIAWDGCTEIRLQGEFDCAVHAYLEPALERAVRTPGHVLVNLEGCDLIDASVLGLLAETDARIVERNGQMHLYGAVGQVRRVLELLGLGEDEKPRLNLQPSLPDIRPTVRVLQAG